MMKKQVISILEKESIYQFKSTSKSSEITDLQAKRQLRITLIKQLQNNLIINQSFLKRPKKFLIREDKSSLQLTKELMS